MTVYISLNILIITSTCLFCSCTKNDEEPINGSRKIMMTAGVYQVHRSCALLACKCILTSTNKSLNYHIVK